MNRTIDYTVKKEEEGLRASQILRRRGFSRQNLIELKKQEESVLANGRACYLNVRLKEGDVLTARIREQESSARVRPVELPLHIVYEDEDILVVCKAAGMPTHPSWKNDDNTLANALAWYYGQQGEAFIFRCTNRLDRDTSGLTVIAKHMVSASILASMTASHALTREYRAVARGSVAPPEGTITAPLSRKPGSLIERVVDFENGEEAVTHYKVLEEKNGHSLIALRLQTGRTHQIRIHMKYLGFPLVGDYLYNPDMEYMSRQALHSYRLRFPHPITGERMEFTAPLPEDMQVFGFSEEASRRNPFPDEAHQLGKI